MQDTDSQPARLTGSDANLIGLAEACSRVRADIGRLLMAKGDLAARAAAAERLSASLRTMLEHARENDAGLLLEVAGGL